MLLHIAKVAVDKAAFRFDKGFSYLAPEGVSVGAQVLVPFGRGSQLRQAIVLEVGQVEPSEETERLKSIAKVLPEEPLGEEMMQLVYFLKERTLCSFFDAVKLLTPKGMRVKVKTYYRLAESFGNFEIQEGLSPQGRELLEVLQEKGETEEEKLKDSFTVSLEPTLKELLALGFVEKTEGVKRNFIDQKVIQVALHPDYHSKQHKLTKRQEELVELLREKGPLSYQEIYYYKQITSSVVQNAHKKGAVLFREITARSDNLGEISGGKNTYTLTADQRAVYEKLREGIDRGTLTPFLLHGVTGSGKTVIYIKSIEYALQKGKNAILLVPEISLTPQMIATFSDYFGETVAVIHSELSVGERYGQYKKVKEGRARIVVGTRSAVFAPTSNVGIVIVDEEQESSYYSEKSPRYSAKDIALFRANYHGAAVVFASATPSVDTYYKGQTGQYICLTLKERFSRQQVPKTTIVDMKEELFSGNTRFLSKPLKEALEKNIEAGKQSILLINRRGYESVALCADCLEVVKCPHCNVALTYHKANNRLMCHYCNHIETGETVCGSCGGKRLTFVGFGTQKIEEELTTQIAGAKVLRMDMDTTSQKGAHGKLLKQFRNQEYNILVGTQMIAKGLDFENVTLAGVLNVESLLYYGGYKGHEKLFSLVAQVIGRSGRGGFSGRALIQTIEPEHPVLTLAASQDYESFYKEEIRTRKALLYPPFCDICLVGFKQKNEELTLGAAKAFVENLKEVYAQRKESLPLKVLGPSPFQIVKVADRYRYKVIIKCKNNRQFRNFLRAVLERFLQDKTNSKVEFFVDFHSQNEV